MTVFVIKPALALVFLCPEIAGMGLLDGLSVFIGTLFLSNVDGNRMVFATNGAKREEGVTNRQQVIDEWQP